MEPVDRDGRMNGQRFILDHTTARFAYAENAERERAECAWMRDLVSSETVGAA